MTVELESIRIVVRGKVQGVFYRQTSKEKAKKFGISGFVKNQQDGQVLIIATGTKDQLQNFITWCREGPPHAIVSDVNIESLPLQIFDNFNIER